MNFKKLKTSLDINAKEEPSIYTALCLMETLIMDYEEETGKKFEEIDIGDETLPLKMTRIYRTLNKVYSNKKDDFSRGVSRLEGMVQEAESIDKALDSMSGDCEKLNEFSSSLSAKKKAYEEALESKERCDEMQKEIDAIDEKLESLKKYNPAELSALLNAKNEEFDKIGGEVTTLVKDLEEAEDQLKQMKEFKTARQNEFSSIQDEIKELQKENDSYSQEIDDIPRRKQKLRDDVVRKRIVLQGLQEELEEYSKRESLPLEEQIKLAEEKIKKASIEAETKSDEIKQLEEKYTQLTYSLETKNKEIENFSAMCDERNTAFNEKTQEFEQVKQQWNDISTKYNSIIDELETTRKSIEEYETEKIPNTEFMLKDKARQKDELVVKLESLNKEVESLNLEVDEINTQLEPAVLEAERLSDLKSNLTADYGRRSAQIEELKAELEELTGKSDAEKLNSYENQLRKQIENKKNEENKLREYEEEIDQITLFIESSMIRQKELENQRDKLNKSRDDLDAKIKSLAVFDDPKIRKETDKTVKKLVLLKSTSDKLLKHMQDISKITGVQVDSIDNVTQIKMNIESLNNFANSLSEELDNYSKTVKLEVRE